MLLSCCWLLVTEVSLHCKVTEPHYVKTVGVWRQSSVSSTAACDIIAQSWGPQTDEEGGMDMIECGIVKGDYSWRLWNVSSANQIKSRIIPAGKKKKQKLWVMYSIINKHCWSKYVIPLGVWRNYDVTFISQWLQKNYNLYLAFEVTTWLACFEFSCLASENINKYFLVSSLILCVCFFF